jgi:cyclohexanone monooxygenase
VEPTAEAQDQWCATIKETAAHGEKFQRECTPGYYNNEGEELIRSYLGEPYWPGFQAFDDLLATWRDSGELEGLVLGD